MPAGFFITFEGPDGSGKTTQLRRLAAMLLSRGLDVVSVRQPGGTPLGDRIRSLLVDSSTDEALGPIAPLAELGLMFSDRAQAIAQVIQPALDAGKIVLCDRFTDSSEAYQGAGRCLGRERVLLAHTVLCGDLTPDLTILLLPPLEASLHRARRRNQKQLDRDGRDENRFEAEADDFHRRVHAAYAEIARREPGRVAPITDDAGIDAIEARIDEIVWKRLPPVVQPA